MEETIEQKIIRNIQGKFAVYKTPEVVGSKSLIPNIEWENPEEIDKFFMFAQNMGAKVIYLTEGEETDEETNQTTNTFLQVGFLHQGIMHHINFIEEDDDEEDDEDVEYEDETETEDVKEDYQKQVKSPQTPQNPPRQQIPPQQQTTQETPTQQQTQSQPEQNNSVQQQQFGGVQQQNQF